LFIKTLSPGSFALRNIHTSISRPPALSLLSHLSLASQMMLLDLVRVRVCSGETLMKGRLALFNCGPLSQPGFAPTWEMSPSCKFACSSRARTRTMMSDARAICTSACWIYNNSHAYFIGFFPIVRVKKQENFDILASWAIYSIFNWKYLQNCDHEF
jgi:hypothetical protein